MGSSNKDPSKLYLQLLSKLELETNNIETNKLKVVNTKSFNNITNSKTNILYVIDMQYDFVNSEGAFSVFDGEKCDTDINEFLNTNNDKFKKIIFSRDFHPKNHCSFNGDNSFPKHCVINEKGANFTNNITTFINDNKDKCKVVFKGFNKEIDSFGAEQYKKDYCVLRQYGNCKGRHCGWVQNNSGKWQLGHGGGYTLNNSTIDKDIADKVKDFNINNVTLFNLSKDIDIDDETNIFVCGLAGDFCVKDTAINLKGKFPKNNIYVINNLTRYAVMDNSFITEPYKILEHYKQYEVQIINCPLQDL